jgi:hypothetical protein
MPRGSRLYLTQALRAYLTRYWDRPPEQIQSVSVEDGKATVNLRSMRGLGIASTSCGSVGFMGSIERTLFQFDSVRTARIELAGSCRAFGDYMQAARCSTLTRRDISR